MHRNWLVVEDARIHVNTGLVLDGRGSPVRLTRYLRTGRSDRLKRLKLPSEAEPFGRPLVVGYNASYANHYHWLTQCLFPAWLWARSAIHREALFLTPILNSTQQQSWPLARVAASGHHQAPAGTMISVPRAIVIPDAFLPGADDPSPLLREFARDISERIDDDGEWPAAIYISRRDSSKRPMGNEAELECALSEAGFHIVTLSGRTFQDQVRLFRSARLIVSPHGAGLANVIFCRPRTRVIELMPSVRDNRCMERLSAVCGVHHDVVLVPATGDSTSLQWQVDTNSLVCAIRNASYG